VIKNIKINTFEIPVRMKKFIMLFTVTLITYSSLSQMKQIIPVESKNNRTYLTVKIGEHFIPDILLDSGFASDGLMLFNPAYRDSLDVGRVTEVRIGGAGSGEGATALMVEGESFSVGELEMSNQPVIILRNNPGFFAKGLIGYSIFGHYITEFNYDNNTMTLYDPGMAQIDNSWEAIPIYFKNNRIPWVDAYVGIDNEKPVLLSMYIDFAAGDAIVLLEKQGMKFSLPVETTDILIGKGLSGDIYGKSGKISSLIIGPYQIDNIKASFAPAEVRSKQDNADAILGNESLRRFNLIFDYINKKLYLKPNSHFKDPYN
jgi:hypothetical protein